MNNKYTVLTILLLAAMVQPLLAQATSDHEFTFAVTDNPKFKFSNVIGDLEISGWDKPEIQVVAKKYAEGANSKQLLNDLKIQASNNGSTVVISVAYPSKKNWDGKTRKLGADFKVYVPFNTRVYVKKLVAGELEAKDISGDIYLETITGEITAERLSGEVTLKTIAGDIEVEELHGRSTIHTVNGDIDISEVTGEVKIHSTSGSITVEAIDLEELEINSTSGDVDVSIDSAVTFGSFNITLMSGDIDMTIAESSAFYAVITANEGDVSSEFDLAVSKKFMKKEASGEINGGGASIIISVFTGDIELNSR